MSVTFYKHRCCGPSECMCAEEVLQSTLDYVDHLQPYDYEHLGLLTSNPNADTLLMPDGKVLRWNRKTEKL